MRVQRPRLVDLLIAAAITAALVASMWLESPRAGFSWPGSWLGATALVIGGLALVARRHKPLEVLAITGIAALVHQGLGIDVPALAYLMALFTAVRAGHLAVGIWASVAMLVLMPVVIRIGVGLDWREAFAQARSALELAWLVAATAAGEAVRQAERRAEQAERTKDEAAARRADEERLRIARELHDSLTHQISVIKLHAEVAVHQAGRQEQSTQDRLLAIRAAAREASAELRSTLGMVRDPAGARRGLTQIPTLIDAAANAGLSVSYSCDVPTSSVSGPLGEATFRIVQEALTNVVRHAPGATATVAIRRMDQELVVEVMDQGGPEGSADQPPGLGVIGMRERVSALGGTVDLASSVPDGFIVRARLPMGASA